ncbi:glycyl-tRNA synthetase beta chain [Natronobacillus azotifigens]|uniref:Glycine--tRNA ligase beta subunit n=1 Tax=Natronobacillus azotifigens TaxID=472978 RepID=A0A9J6RE67_9BACI|nr:glycine--tRNA ligase subunit beta [Natronobacillus azotifigens]MCZ0704034.1 glycine--tRNA ligase subunit beta [Natronobacillus azotifigens]
MKKTNVLFEIGLEEMPARFLADAEKQLKSKTMEWLHSIRLSYQAIQTFATPRRLAILIKEVDGKQPDLEEEAKGPAKKIAMDDEGNWSKAAIGFTKGQGRSVEDIYFKEINGTEYAHVHRFTEGKSASELLPKFKDVILSLTFPKNMRWSTGSLRFIRPIRWLVALNDEAIIPFEIAGVETSNYTYGHRFLGDKVTIKDAISYQQTLADQFVVARSEDRKASITAQMNELQQLNNWVIPADADLLEEVSQLVEYPTVFSGSFSEEFLIVPEEALITSMKEHQRYFPVLSGEGKLLPHFIAVRNGNDQNIDTVARGNEKVLSARLSDAMFFYQEDKKQSIEKNMLKLERMVFQESLGTIADKVSRVITITEKIAELLGLDDSLKTQAQRAAAISKFDLVTNMVNEFTNLQGIMGEKYARIAGEEEAVAIAINEHYMPRYANDQLPESTIGSIVSIADKLDTIVGCIAVGIIPSGSQDPYALRRQAMGVIQIVEKQNWSITIEALLTLVENLFQGLGLAKDDIKIVEQNVLTFFKARAAYLIRSEEIEQDIVDAVLANGIGQISNTIAKAKYLTNRRADPTFKPVQEALVRVIKLAKKGKDKGVDVSLFENEEEKVLYTVLQEVKKPYLKKLQENNFEQAIELLAKLVEPIDSFFEHTMVMTEDVEKKENRISLLNKIAKLVLSFADLSEVEWKQQFTS